jgi:hypothetical protein
MKVQLEATTKAKQLGEVNMFLALRYPTKVFHGCCKFIANFLVELSDSHLGAVY